MLSKELNELLTQVGPGTPGGNLMRYYWYPIAGAVELDENPVKKVRLLGEDLVLFRDRSGNLGLIDEPCPHRRVSLEYGIPEAEGLRCPYHGWVFNHEGKCREQPAEPWDSTFKDRVTTKAYRAQELGGIIFAYMGPEPAPLIPRYDVLVWENVVRHIGITMLPCNYMQAMENSLDPTHVEWLHGYYSDYVWSRKDPSYTPWLQSRHKKIGFDRFEHGLIKRRVVEGETEESDSWRVGHPIIFPHILRVGGGGNYGFQYRVPVDDTHTMHLMYTAYRPGIPIPPQDSVPVYEIPLYDESGKFLTEVGIVQDFFAWASQGAIAQRDQEHLGQADIGVIMYRELLREQIEKVQRGEEPMEVYRDPAKNVCIDIPQEELATTSTTPTTRANRAQQMRNNRSQERFSPIREDIIGLFEQAADRANKGERLTLTTEAPSVPVGAVEHREVVIQP